MVKLAQLVLMALLALMAIVDSQDLLEQEVQLALLDPQVHRVNVDQLGRQAHLVRLDLEDPLDQVDHGDLVDLLDLLDL